MELQERDQIFKENLSKFSNEIDLQTLTDFYDYWSEPNRTGKKMRFELEKTWDLSRRLKRWINNQNSWHGNKTYSGSNAAHKPGTSEARIIALKKWGT